MTQGSKSLLIVDDENIVRNVMLCYFSKHGFKTFAESNGKDALEWIKSHPVGLVLLDIEMPEMNGFDMLKALRKSHTPDQLPVIMVTGRAGADDVETALAAGANDYVTKPIDFPDLLARIQTLLSRKHAEKVRNESGKGFILAARDTNGSMWE